ncbi:MAG TPA: hypothetical protein VMT70_24590, partial [Vicinamibacteria bacterium]|nr:hypothetical protein [Vicinamibacteria bacterium]
MRRLIEEASSSPRPARRVAARVLLVAAALLGLPVALGTALVVLVVVGAAASWVNFNLDLFAAHPRLAVAAAGAAVAWLIIVGAVTGAAIALRPRRGQPPEGDRPAPAFEGVGVDRSTPRRRWAAPAELLGYVVIVIATTWPLVNHLGDQVTGFGDARYFVWLGWRVGRLISSGHLLPTFIPDVVWPYGFDLRLGEGYLPMVVNGLWNLVAPPVAAYNLSLLTATGINLWAGRRLGKLVSADRLVWMLAAVAFATAPSLSIRLLGHHAVYFAFPTALVVEEAALFSTGRTAVRWVRLGLLWFLCYLCASYFLIGSAIVYAAMCLAGARRRPLSRRILVEIGAALALTAALMAPFLWKRAELERAETAAGRRSNYDFDYRFYAADGLALVAQPPGSTIDVPGMRALGSGFADNVPEGTIFPGLLLLTGLAVCAALPSHL